ncbi:MAG: hypothetical protein JW955_06170 [Sedimentisphaerales bacterium]|nr:hypothetical protein [Sedimentisphaerales bacterium]
MNRHKFVVLAALATILIHASLTLAVDYFIASGYTDSEYNDYGWCKVAGLVDAFNGIGLTQYKLVGASPWQFYENSLMPSSNLRWPFDAIRADYATLGVFCGHAGTFKDKSANKFCLFLQARDAFGGTDVIAGEMMALGESLSRDSAYPGYCRYFMALGCNTVAMGPAMSDAGNPTFSRPDLYDRTNSNHADPAKIWWPVMTDGLRMVMGFTDYSYSGNLDRGKWQKFKTYYDMGGSIAWSFANTALDASSYHKPVVLTQGRDGDECLSIENEHYFRTYRPNGNGTFRWHWWGSDRVRSFNGYYVWDGPDPAGASNGGADRTTDLPSEGWVYESSDAGAGEDPTIERYLAALGAESNAMLFDAPRERATYKIADGRQLSVDRRSGCLLYQDAQVSALNGPSGLSQDECIELARSFLIDSKIVGPNEVVVDSVVTETYMTVTDRQSDPASQNPEPQVARYTVVLKRNLGELPILTNDTDTIRVEIGQNGKIASLVSSYKYGRRVSKVESVKGALPDTWQARAVFAKSGSIQNIRAGMLPMPDGTYVPVYEVAAVTFPDGRLPVAQITCHRMDTLEPVVGDEASAGDDHTLGSDEPASEPSK